MKTYTQYRQIKEEESADELNRIRPTNEIIDEVNDSIEQLEQLLKEDFDYKFDLHAEILKEKVTILSEDVIENNDDNEKLVKIMFKKLRFDAFGEQILEHSDGKRQFEITPRMSFENFEDGNFYQEIGDGIVYYYSFDTKKWNRR